jgi:hypothetical protein
MLSVKRQSGCVAVMDSSLSSEIKAPNLHALLDIFLFVSMVSSLQENDDIKSGRPSSIFKRL